MKVSNCNLALRRHAYDVLLSLQPYPIVIKSLGKDFCKIQNKNLSDEELKKKPLPKKAARPRVKQGKKNNLKMPMKISQRRRKDRCSGVV
jgi:hypothetical protein